MIKNTKKIYSYSVFYESTIGGGYVAFVPALPGCHTQGETLEESEKNIKEAIELYLESLAAHKESIPEEVKSFQGNVKVPVLLPQWFMQRVPSVTARKIIRALKRAGFIEDRQKGSHLILIHPKTNARTVVPIHSGKTLKQPLVRAIINDAQLSIDEFLKFL